MKANTNKKNLAKSRLGIPRAPRSEVSLGRFGSNAMRSVIMNGLVGTVTAGVTSQFGAIEIALDNLSGYASYAAAWDKYRIEKVELTFIPNCNTHNLSIASSSSTTQVAPIATVLDFDDGNSLSTTASAEEYGTYKVHNPFLPFHRKYVPKVAMAVYDTALVTGYSQPDEPVWIDVSNTSVPHYGLKWAAYSNGGTQSTFQKWFVYVKAWVSFAQSR